MKRFFRNLRLQASKKLRSRAGESIGETMFALLISALALTMLAGAISSSGQVILKSERVMERYYEGMNSLAGSGVASGLSVQMKDDDTGAIVKLFGGAEDEGEDVVVTYTVNAVVPHKPVVSYRVTD